jgi:hypothetical protein
MTRPSPSRRTSPWLTADCKVFWTTALAVGDARGATGVGERSGSGRETVEIDSAGVDGRGDGTILVRSLILSSFDLKETGRGFVGVVFVDCLLTRQAGAREYVEDPYSVDPGVLHCFCALAFRGELCAVHLVWSCLPLNRPGQVSSPQS